MTANRHLVGIRQHPRLAGAHGYEHLRCHLSGPRRGSCNGYFRAGTEVMGAFRVGRGVDRCEIETDMQGFGGADCGPNQPCPAIGYFINGRDIEPRGCG